MRLLHSKPSVAAKTWRRSSAKDAVSACLKLVSCRGCTHLHIDVVYGVVPQLFLRQSGEEVFGNYELFQIKTKHVRQHVCLARAFVIVVPVAIVTVIEIGACRARKALIR